MLSSGAFARAKASCRILANMLLKWGFFLVPRASAFRELRDEVSNKEALKGLLGGASRLQHKERKGRTICKASLPGFANLCIHWEMRSGHKRHAKRKEEGTVRVLLPSAQAVPSAILQAFSTMTSDNSIQRDMDSYRLCG